MSIDTIFQVSAAILASVGGAAAIILSLSTWLGKVWANRILEQDKLNYAKELEKLKNQMQYDSERQRLIFATYFQGQFQIYNKLWVSLVELQERMDALWINASLPHLRRFIDSVQSAKKQIKSSALLIDPEHYKDIVEALSDIENYRIGKERLAQARRSLLNIRAEEIEKIISENGRNRDRITQFIDQMCSKMRVQIGGGLEIHANTQPDHSVEINS